MTTELALMEGVERTNAIIVHPQQGTELVQCNPYAMNINRERNCYACGGFRHMAQHCWNRGQRSGVIKGRRLEYGGISAHFVDKIDAMGHFQCCGIQLLQVR